MTLSGTCNQVALVHQFARFNLSFADITEAQIPSRGQYSIEDALLLHSGGDHHINGVALIARPPFSNTLVSWQSISGRPLLARFAHKHSHLSIIVEYDDWTVPSSWSIKCVSSTKEYTLVVSQVQMIRHIVQPYTAHYNSCYPESAGYHLIFPRYVPEQNICVCCRVFYRLDALVIQPKH